MTDADGVRWLVAVVGERKHVAVAGKSLAQAVRHGETFLARAQQDFRRAERARAEHHDTRENGALGLAELVAAIACRREEHAPAFAFLAHEADRRFGEDLGAMTHGIRQIGHLHGILGTDIAARAAVTA